MYSWKENIATAVLGCAGMSLVPDTPVPEDLSLEAGLPQPTLTKVEDVPPYTATHITQEELVRRLQTRMGMEAVEISEV